mmetsp:Transcript_6716/g.10610  ORF Transcript_6716/g.10610 Transcript_6716/m.10610 type:complete len:273 (+) Transcript_6716:169-987(+)
MSSLEHVFTRFGESVKASVDGIEQVVKCNGFVTGSNQEDEKLDLFVSKFDELAEKIEYCERLYGKENTLQSLVDALKKRMERDEQLIQLVATAKGHEFEVCDEEPEMDCIAKTPVRKATMCRTERTPLPTPQLGRPSCYEKLVSPADSDPPTPTLEDFGLSDRYQVEDTDLLDEETNFTYSPVLDPRPGIRYITANDLVDIPGYLRNRVTPEMLNELLGVIAHVASQATDGNVTIEELEIHSADIPLKAALTILISLKALESTRSGVYALVS